MGKQLGVIQFTGKLGQTVGYKGQSGRANIRVKVDEAKNPRTAKQCIQRMIAATASIALSYGTEVFNNSVEGKKNGNETLNYLRSQWMRMLRPEDFFNNNNFCYVPKGQRFMAANPYLISKGSLRGVSFTHEASGGKEQIVLGAATGYSKASELFPEVAVGDQITILALVYEEAANGVTSRLEYMRFAFKTDSAPLIQDGANFKLNPNAIDVAKAEGVWQELVFVPEAQTKIVLPYSIGNLTGSDVSIPFVGIIVSNIEKKRRSTSYMQLGTGMDMGDFAYGWDAYESYQEQSSSMDMPSSVYLDNSAVVNTSGSSGGGDVAGAFALNPSAPISLSNSDSTSVSIEGTGTAPTAYPINATDVRLNFKGQDNVEFTSKNIVNLTNGAILAEGSVYAEALSIVGTWAASAGVADSTVTINSEATGVMVLGGYMIIDSVKYTF